MTRSRDVAPSLKEACVQAAREVIAEHGVESLSMRDVARKLDISHQAPYRHFESRDHLLAEIMRRCFAEFAQHLDDRPRTGNPAADLESMGHAYLRYARMKPLEYRLMFGTPWPEPAQHPALVRHAVHAFNLLRDSLRALHGGQPEDHAQADRQAMFIWSTLHGNGQHHAGRCHAAPEPGPWRGTGLAGRHDGAHRPGAGLARGRVRQPRGPRVDAHTGVIKVLEAAGLRLASG